MVVRDLSQLGRSAEVFSFPIGVQGSGEFGGSEGMVVRDLSQLDRSTAVFFFRLGSRGLGNLEGRRGWLYGISSGEFGG